MNLVLTLHYHDSILYNIGQYIASMVLMGVFET